MISQELVNNGEASEHWRDVREREGLGCTFILHYMHLYDLTVLPLESTW